MNFRGTILCDGEPKASCVLIASEFILTCKHVTAGREMHRFQVQFEDQIVNIKECIQHPELDVSRCRLSEPINRSQPLPLLRGVTRQYDQFLRRNCQLSISTNREMAVKFSEFHDASPFTMKSLQFDGGALDGNSGSPVIIECGKQPYCIGLLYLGGSTAGQSRLIPTDEILREENSSKISLGRWKAVLDELKALTSCCQIVNFRELDLRKTTKRSGASSKRIGISEDWSPLLTAGMEDADYGGQSGVEQFLARYLGHGAHQRPLFGGRDKQMDVLSRWLTLSESQYALLPSVGGSGKSSLLAHFAEKVSQSGEALVAFVPISVRDEISRKPEAVSLLGSRMRYLAGAYSDGAPDHAASMSSDLWLKSIDQILRSDRSANEKPLLVILDGVDEAVGWEFGRDIRFPVRLGTGVKVLLSFRSLSEADTQARKEKLGLPPARVFSALSNLDEQGIIDALITVEAGLIAGSIPEIAKNVFRVTRGFPLLVGIYLESMREKDGLPPLIKPEDLNTLSDAEKDAGIREVLDRYFHFWWQKYQEQRILSEIPNKKIVFELFNLFSCALGPLTLSDIYDLSEGEVVANELEWGIQPLRFFLSGDGRKHGFVFNHPGLGQYFYANLLPQESKRLESKFLRLGKKFQEQFARRSVFGDQKTHAMNEIPYALRCFGAHLERAEAPLVDFDSMITREWALAWYKAEKSYEGFLFDLEKAERRLYKEFHDNQTAAVVKRLIPHQFKYGLARASINSIYSQIGPNFLATLVKKGRWTFDQAIRHISRMPSAKMKADAFHNLLPLLKAAEVDRCVSYCREITRQLAVCEERLHIICAIANHLAQSEIEAFIEAEFTAKDIHDTVITICRLAPFIEPGKVRRRYLDLLVAILHKLGAGAFIYLKEAARVLDEDLADKLYDSLDASQVDDWRSGRVAKLFTRLSKGKKEEVAHTLLERVLLIGQSSIRLDPLLILREYADGADISKTIQGCNFEMTEDFEAVSVALSYLIETGQFDEAMNFIKSAVRDGQLTFRVSKVSLEEAIHICPLSIVLELSDSKDVSLGNNWGHVLKRLSELGEHEKAVSLLFRLEPDEKLAAIEIAASILDGKNLELAQALISGIGDSDARLYFMEELASSSKEGYAEAIADLILDDFRGMNKNQKHTEFLRMKNGFPRKRLPELLNILEECFDGPEMILSVGQFISQYTPPIPEVVHILRKALVVMENQPSPKYKIMAYLFFAPFVDRSLWHRAKGLIDALESRNDGEKMSRELLVSISNWMDEKAFLDLLFACGRRTIVEVSGRVSRNMGAESIRLIANTLKQLKLEAGEFAIPEEEFGIYDASLRMLEVGMEDEAFESANVEIEPELFISWLETAAPKLGKSNLDRACGRVAEIFAFDPDMGSKGACYLIPVLAREGAYSKATDLTKYIANPTLLSHAFASLSIHSQSNREKMDLIRESLVILFENEESFADNDYYEWFPKALHSLATGISSLPLEHGFPIWCKVLDRLGRSPRKEYYSSMIACLAYLERAHGPEIAVEMARSTHEISDWF